MKKSYSKENRAHRKLYWDFGLAGFGSGFNLLVLAICYAEKSKLKFVLFSKYSSISYQNGFTDYFLPFAEPEKSETILFPHISFRFPQKKSKIKKVLVSILRHTHFLLKEKRRNVICFENMASRIWNPNFISSNSFESYQEIARRIWRFNSETQNYCESKTEALSLPNSYACIHVRRGDKSTEVQEPFPDISKYIEYAQTNEIEVESYFIMTDDYSVFEEFKEKFPALSFYTLAEKNRRGHWQKTFNSTDKNKKRVDMLNLLTEIEIAKKSKLFIGTESSNLYRLIALFKEANTCISVDTWKVSLF